MKAHKLELSKAPSCGDMLAYTRREVIFHPYTSVDDVMDELEDKELLELHLFDDSKEYRAIVSESKRFADKEFIEHVADFKANTNESESAGEYVYTEKCIIEKGGGRLDVLTKFKYSDNGMLVADDYRLRKE